MKETIYWLAKYVGIFALCRWFTRKNIRILAFHGIWMGEGHFGNFLYMSSERFASRMSLLSKLRFPVVPLDYAIENRNKGNLPDCATVITIDDGWYSTFLHMLPILEKNNYPATVYVTTYYSEKQTPVFDVALQYMMAITKRKRLSLQSVDTSCYGDFDLANMEQKALAREQLQSYVASLEGEDSRQEMMNKIGDMLGVPYSEIIDNKLFHLMTPEQIEEMSCRGVDIQLHTHRHRISHLGKDCISEEIKGNRESLKPFTSKSLIHFCYPSGVYDESVWPQLEAAGIVSATTTETGLVNQKPHKYALPRILDGEYVSDIEFEAELVGFGELKRKLISAVSRKHL